MTPSPDDVRAAKGDTLRPDLSPTNCNASPGSRRVEDLLASLTLDEKCILLSGKNMWETLDIPELGIGSLKMTDGPAGVRGSRWTDGTHTTQIPCGISLGATFNPDLIWRVGRILGLEARSKQAHILLAPTMNISRSPFGGRNFENFGEDPFLTGSMSLAYIQGVQSQGVGACMKHYVANDQETRRFNMDEYIDDRTLHEIYLRPFKMALEAEPWTAMTAYPKINGEHADTSCALVKDILRAEWGYDGLVMSDWGGLNDTVKSIQASTDLEMPGPPLRYGPAVRDAVLAGKASEAADINPSVRRLLQLLAKAGRLDEAFHPGGKGSEEANGDSEGETELTDPWVHETAREAAGEGIVLLKNDNDLLPLSPTRLTKLAIVGPNAKTPTTGGTGSAIVNPYYISTPLEAIREAALAANPSIEVRYERGIMTQLKPPLMGDCLVAPNTGEPGFQVDFYSSPSFEEFNPDAPAVATTNWHDSLVYFMSDGDVPESLRSTQYTYKATGILRPSSTGTYDFSLSNTGQAKLFIDGSLLIDNTSWTEISGNFMNCGSVEVLAPLHLEAGRSYTVRVDNVVTPPPTPAHDNTLFHRISGVRVGLQIRQDEDEMFQQAVMAAREADVTLLVVGHNNDTEREGSDRTSLSLPGRTEELVRAVCGAAGGAKVVVVTQSACAVAMPWVDGGDDQHGVSSSAPSAMLHAWYQGQECGNALADVLFGKVTPSGKLPISFPRQIEDHGSHQWFPGDAVTDRALYGEGVLVGYRWFDSHNITPLWPFGFGLSYTRFQITNAVVAAQPPESNGSGRGRVRGQVVATITVSVENVGQMAGSEVIQIYTSASPEISKLGLASAPRSLAGFAKVGVLAPGESKTASIAVTSDSIAWYDAEGGRWRVDEGVYSFFVGTSSRHIMTELQVIIE